MAAAFTDPIPAAKPLGFRFTVGGGKKVSRNCCAATVVPIASVAVAHSSAAQVRAKYGEDMTKWCREALRSMGFEEDRWRAMSHACLLDVVFVTSCVVSGAPAL